MLLLHYRLRKSLKIRQAGHTFLCSMLPPSGSNVRWLHPHHLGAPSEFLPQGCSSVISSHSFSSAHFTRSLLSLPSHIWRLRSDVPFFLQRCHCLPDLYLFFLGTQCLLMEYQDCLFVFTPMLLFIIILGAEIARIIRMGLKISIALNYQNQL